MADYSALRETIDNNIYTNGEQRITGDVLNSVLNEIVTAMEESGEGAIISSICDEEGLYFVDELMNVGVKIDNNGFDAINALTFEIV